MVVTTGEMGKPSFLVLYYYIQLGPKFSLVCCNVLTLHIPYPHSFHRAPLLFAYIRICIAYVPSAVVCMCVLCGVSMDLR